MSVSMSRTVSLGSPAAAPTLVRNGFETTDKGMAAVAAIEVKRKFRLFMGDADLSSHHSILGVTDDSPMIRAPRRVSLVFIRLRDTHIATSGVGPIFLTRSQQLLINRAKRSKPGLVDVDPRSLMLTKRTQDPAIIPLGNGRARSPLR